MNHLVTKRIYLDCIGLVLLFLFTSCVDDCHEEIVEKAEWETRYEKHSMDTLVSYSVSSSAKKTAWKNTPSKRDRHTYSVVITNNNGTYSNAFAVRFDCYNGSTYWSETTDFVEIPPHSEHRFENQWNGGLIGESSDFEISQTILQRPKKIRLTKRIDELHISNEQINTCEQSVEAVQKKYNTIKELYYQKVDSVNWKIVK